MSVRPAARAATTASGPKPLVTASTLTRSGSPPTRLMRALTSATRAATSSGTEDASPLPEEGGHVEIVVTEVEFIFRAGGFGEDVDRLGRPGEEGGRAITGGGTPAVLPAIEPGCDHGAPHLVTPLVVDDGTENYVGVGMGHTMDDLRRLVHLEESEVRSAG